MNSDGFVALTRCFYCGEPNEILLNRRMGHNKFIEAADGKVVDMNPCPKCEEYMKQGVILIAIDEDKCERNWNMPDKSNKHWMPNPYRTGGFFVIKEEAFSEIFNPCEALDFALEHRWMFIDEKAAKAIGLYKEEEEKQ